MPRLPLQPRRCAWRVLALLCVAIVNAGGVAEAQEGPAADAVTAARLRAHHAALMGHASIQADVVTTTTDPPSVTQGRIVLQGESAYFRVEFVSNGTISLIQESVVTPTLVSTIYHETKTATKIDLVRLRKQAPEAVVPNAARDTILVFDNLSPGSTRYLGPVQQDGETLDHFRVTNPDPDVDEGELLVWVNPDDGVPRRMELRSATGRLLLERVFVNVKLDGAVPEGLFTLTYPKGVKVDDVTRDYIAQQKR